MKNNTKKAIIQAVDRESNSIGGINYALDKIGYNVGLMSIAGIAGYGGLDGFKSIFNTFKSGVENHPTIYATAAAVGIVLGTGVILQGVLKNDNIYEGITDALAKKGYGSKAILNAVNAYEDSAENNSALVSAVSNRLEAVKDLVSDSTESTILTGLRHGFHLSSESDRNNLIAAYQCGLKYAINKGLEDGRVMGKQVESPSDKTIGDIVTGMQAYYKELDKELPIARRAVDVISGQSRTRPLEAARDGFELIASLEYQDRTLKRSARNREGGPGI